MGARHTAGVEGWEGFCDVVSMLFLYLDDGCLCLFNNSLNCVRVYTIYYLFDLHIYAREKI